MNPRALLRWAFWGLVYLAVTLTALVLFVGMLPVVWWLRWACFGVIVWGLTVDARHKVRNGPGRGGPPDGGELRRAEARR